MYSHAAERKMTFRNLNPQNANEIAVSLCIIAQLNMKILKSKCLLALMCR